MQAGLEHMHGSNAFLGQLKGWFLFLASLSDKDVVRYSIILEQDSGLLSESGNSNGSGTWVLSFLEGDRRENHASVPCVKKSLLFPK